MPALLLPNEILSMSAQAVRRLVEAGEGDPALLYLALLEGKDTEKAGQALHWGDDRLAAAYRRLAELGLAAEEGAPAPRQDRREDQQPSYSRGDLAAALEEEPEFRGLYLEVERLLGRRLGDGALETLYMIYDHLAFQPEIILLLVNYVVRTVRRRQDNPGASPRISQVKSEAFRWKKLGLDTVEAVEDYIRRQEQVDGREWDILSAVGVRKRRPAVEREREYIDSWVELGLSDELIALAYERTVFKKGEMNWPYMNKILLSWHQSGWRTAEQVRNNDKPPVKGKPKAAAPAAGEDYQPTFQRIQKNDQWLDEFLKQQGSEV